MLWNRHKLDGKTQHSVTMARASRFSASCGGPYPVPLASHSIVVAHSGLAALHVSRTVTHGGVEMTGEDARRFGEEWVACWNWRDLDGVLFHLAESVRFTSPKAVARVGTATVDGKAALRAYWEAALAQSTRLHFALGRVLHDADANALVIVYTAEINGERTRACEFYRFDADGLAIEGEAMYGVPL